MPFLLLLFITDETSLKLFMLLLILSLSLWSITQLAGIGPLKSSYTKRCIYHVLPLL